ncbi:MAG: hypothetical protein IPI02_04255 [Sterolibacteriaceae bacterium]|nr:hypothetical protein [Sterolibacteriaceae bacterium]
MGRRSRVAAALVGSAALLILTAPRAQSHPGEVIAPPKHPTAHVHDHGDQTWPPQPRGIEDVVDFSQPGFQEARRLKRQQRFNELEQRSAARTDFQGALGRRFTRIAVVDEEDKTGKARGSRFTYFSRSNNATVEVRFDGARVSSLKSIPASEYQPEITDEEIAEATALARNHFLGLGQTRIDARIPVLKGYGILAYRREGKGFYDGRVIYVSFHADDDAPPEFMAWVDLTKQTVMKTREER